MAIPARAGIILNAWGRVRKFTVYAVYALRKASLGSLNRGNG